MRAFYFLVVAASVLAGCTTVSHVPLSKDASQSLQGKTVARTEYPAPDFTAMTPGKAAFALLGAAAMVSEGNAIVKNNEIADPALAISMALASRLEAARASKTIERPISAAIDEPAALAAGAAAADFVLDVKTLNWMFGYYPTNWSGYRVMYAARLRLIDAKSRAVVAETACQTIQGDDAAPPSMEQLLDGKAALLKDYLGKAAVQCADVLARDVLQL